MRTSGASERGGRRRGATLIGVGTLALTVVVTGIVAAWAGRSALTQEHRRAQTGDPVIVVSETPPAPKEKAGNGKSQEKEPRDEESPVVEATAEPILADGVFPAYVRGVNVAGAMVTLDLVQVFEDEEAVRAAVEDGTPRKEAKYLYIYVRNENDLLRTLPVAEDIRIRFIGGCEDGDRQLMLEQLREETRPFNDSFYFSVSVTGGEIDHIVQHLAIPAC